jgi:hypothetical protein
MRKVTAVVLACAFALSAFAPSAFGFADKFGPGNSGGGNGKCHPPGQTTDVPGCK